VDAYSHLNLLGCTDLHKGASRATNGDSLCLRFLNFTKEPSVSPNLQVCKLIDSTKAIHY
jgi:hypothetical protein